MRVLWLFFAAALARGQAPLGLDAYMAVPADNPLTPAKVALGRKLFFDKRLSRDQSIACASCHKAEHAFTDGRSISEGASGRHGNRNAPTLVNRGYGTAQFWDGRVSTLEEQVLKPIQDPNEMDMTLTEVTGRLGLGPRELAEALSSYVRTIRSGNSRVDRYLSRHGELSPEEELGLRIFRVKGNCVACHVGPNFTDERFHNTGVAWREGRFVDQGRFAITGRTEDRGAFKTPTLREVGRSGPYMHDGSVATLEDVIDYYDHGAASNPELDPEIRPLHLTVEEKRGLAAFLRALNGEITEGFDTPRSMPLLECCPAQPSAQR